MTFQDDVQRRTVPASVLTCRCHAGNRYETPSCPCCGEQHPAGLRVFAVSAPGVTPVRYEQDLCTECLEERGDTPFPGAVPFLDLGPVYGLKDSTDCVRAAELTPLNLGSLPHLVAAPPFQGPELPAGYRARQAARSGRRP